MIKRLQDISFRVSRYFRPLDTWHCGGSDDGSSCVLGPDQQGNCRAIKDCAPEQVAKTWQCTRSELLGGKCKAGPNAHGACGRRRPPCQPVRSNRSRRSRFTWLAAAAALALTVLIVAVDSWQTPTNAGQLSKYHSAFGERQCESCHSIVESPRSSWLQRAFTGSSNLEEHSDNQKCTNCHVLGEESLAVHSLPTETLKEITVEAEQRLANSTDRSNNSLLLLAGKAMRGDVNKAPSCGICHQEHIGSEADISAVSNQQCAVCHTDTFDDFDHHPAFSEYPAKQRTSIIFSHNTHLNKHFSEEDLAGFAPKACIDCHEADSIGRKMEVKGFAQACSSCHLEQVTGESRAGDKGFAMLSIPGVDVDTLTERGVQIGEWPEFSDAEFTPLNYLLIAATDPSLSDRLDAFSKLDLFDLSDADDAQLNLVYDVLWTLKRVYFEMHRGGARVVSRKLSAILPSDSSEGTEIFGLLSPAVIDQAVADAFPNLEDEMIRWLQESEPAFSTTKAKSLASETVDATKVESSVEPSADDDWLSGALDEGGDENEDDDDWLSESLDDTDPEELENSDDDDWFAAALDDDDVDDDSNDSDTSAEDDWLSGELESSTESAEGEDDWLDNIADDSSSPLDDDEFASEDIDAAEEQAARVDNVDIVAKASLEDRTAIGGWYYDGYYLRYRPSGHADRLVVAWIERLNLKAALSLPAFAFGQKMQKSLLGDNSPGSCLKCHSVDVVDAEKGVVTVNWFGVKTSPSSHDFNAFKHQSHFSVIDRSEDDFAEGQASGCLSCHKVNLESDSGLAYDQGATGFDSDFHDLEVKGCASCHAEEPALASCTQCHNYHIGDRSLTGIEDGFNRAGKGQSSIIDVAGEIDKSN